MIDKKLETKDYRTLDDPLGAFCHDNNVSLNPAGSGLLDGLTFAVKDVMDISGSMTKLKKYIARSFFFILYHFIRIIHSNYLVLIVYCE